MALAIAYIQEVLNHVPSTVVVDAQDWPELLRLLKFEDRAEELDKLVLGRMRLRQAAGGYDGLQAQLDALLTENLHLRQRLTALTTPPPVPELVTAEPGAADA